MSAPTLPYHLAVLPVQSCSRQIGKGFYSHPPLGKPLGGTTPTTEDSMRYEYRTVDTSTLVGLKTAERLKAAGWRILRCGLFTIQFERAREAR